MEHLTIRSPNSSLAFQQKFMIPKATKKIGGTRLILGIGIGLALIIIGSALFSAFTLRESTRDEWTQEIENLTLIIAEQASQTLFSANVAMDSIYEAINAVHPKNEKDFVQFASQASLHDLLQDRIRANPVIDVATLVSNNGDVLNFSRSFPPPQINVADSDFFKWHQSHKSNAIFYSRSVFSKTSNQWIFFLSRRIDGSNGEFLGVLSIGISSAVFSKFYEKISGNLGFDSSVSLYRSDLTLMSRWPFTEHLLGEQNLSSSTQKIIIDKKQNHGVLITNSPRFSDANPTNYRMAAAREVPRYPFIVTVVITEELYLANWYRSIRWIFAATSFSISLIALSIILLLKANEKITLEFSERELAQTALKDAHEKLEIRVLERTAELSHEISVRQQAQEELFKVNKRISEVSHRAGMAEVANSVLHNIGNVLNSINVSISQMKNQLKSTPLLNLTKVADLINDQKANLAQFLTHDEKGRQLPQLITMLSTQWETEHKSLINETERLNSSIQHVNDIINKQQSFSGQLGVNETLKVAEIIQSVLDLHLSTFGHPSIELVTENDPELTWTGDKNKLSQIILNLITNATESVAASNAKRQFVKISSHGTNDGLVEIRIADNGVGIKPEVLAKLFSYGFTTKEFGHGFGLHASAIAANEMGGTLRAYSDGEGLGATFILTLPNQSKEIYTNI